MKFKFFQSIGKSVAKLKGTGRVYILIKIIQVQNEKLKKYHVTWLSCFFFLYSKFQ